MLDHDLYEAWKRLRTEAGVPDGFTDKVMDSIFRLQQRPSPLAQVLRGLFRSSAFRVGVCSLAGAAGLLRVLQVVAFFLANQPSR